MSEAAIDRLLALLVGLILLTGVLTWRAGSPDTYWLYAVHGVLSGVLLAATAVKLRRSLPRAWRARRWRELAIAVPLAMGTLGALLIGFAWVAGGRYVEIGPWTVLGWHGVLGWALLALVVVHLALRRRWRVLNPRKLAVGPSLSRRSFVAGGVLGVAGLAVWGVAGLLDVLSAQPRRFTGSRWLPDGGIPPPTTFLVDGIPQIDPQLWRLRVDGNVDRPLELSLEDLRALGLTDQEAVLDCTGGWAMRTTWSGVAMATVLDAAGAGSSATFVDVRSVTGWIARLGIAEARGTLLATGVAGIELPIANGAPCRLVVPNRRGLDWVKWVDQIFVS